MCATIRLARSAGGLQTWRRARPRALPVASLWPWRAPSAVLTRSSRGGSDSYRRQVGVGHHVNANTTRSGGRGQCPTAARDARAERIQIRRRALTAPEPRVRLTHVMAGVVYERTGAVQRPVRGSDRECMAGPAPIGGSRPAAGSVRRQLRPRGRHGCCDRSMLAPDTQAVV
jgi:hypothetical protein